MADKFSIEKRSEVMSHIRSKNTKPEVVVFAYLRANKIYFRKHYQAKSGVNIDIALPRKKKALFIDGDFWHGYTLEKRKDSLPQFWIDKIIRNVKRDRRYRKGLKADGWEVMRVWENSIMRKGGREEALLSIAHFLTRDRS